MFACRLFITCFFFLQGVIQCLATPLLRERDNRYHLKCTNAPKVVAGYYLDPKDAIAPTNVSATCQAEYKYLYCVPGTETYIFFGTLPSTLRPTSSYAKAINASLEYIHQQITVQGDGLISGGHEYLRTEGTGIQIYAEDANRHHLTWGVWGAALSGLEAWMREAGSGYSDATVQINDGRNWVGNAYVGAVNAQDQCVFEGALVSNTPCTAADEEGLVYGAKGGKLC